MLTVGGVVSFATVTVTAANDSNPSNNTATDTDTLTPQVDVSVTKTDFASTVVPGTTGMWHSWQVTPRVA